MILTGKAQIAGVMGWPVAHSRSPRLHGFWLDRYRLDGAYVPMAVRPENLAAALRALPSLGFRGTNLTVPHKEAAIAVLDEVDDQARRIGAVNTVAVREDGRLRGWNTDAFGFLEHLKAAAPAWQARSGPVVVLGAGGSARAVCAALTASGVPEVRLVNRTMSRAEAVARAIGGEIRPVAWSEREQALDGAGLLVNTTVLGMAGQAPLDIDLSALPVSAVVYDIVYVPLRTALLNQAARRGNPTVDGLGMLLHQARPGFAAWFGVEPTVDAELHAFVLQDLAR